MCAPVSSSAIASSPVCRRLLSTVLSVSQSLRTDFTGLSLDCHAQSPICSLEAYLLGVLRQCKSAAANLTLCAGCLGCRCNNLWLDLRFLSK